MREGVITWSTRRGDRDWDSGVDMCRNESLSGRTNVREELTSKPVLSVKVRVQRWIVIHFHLAIDLELFAARPDIAK